MAGDAFAPSCGIASRAVTDRSAGAWVHASVVAAEQSTAAARIAFIACPLFPRAAALMNGRAFHCAPALTAGWQYQAPAFAGGCIAAM
jgi:hypothetical protein